MVANEKLRAINIYDTDKDCAITVTTHFLFKNWDGNSKYNIEISVDLMSRNHCRAEQAVITFILEKVSFVPAKTTSTALRWLQNKLYYKYYLLTPLDGCFRIVYNSKLLNLFSSLSLFFVTQNWESRNRDFIRGKEDENFVTPCDRGTRGLKNCLILHDVIFEQPHISSARSKMFAIS